MEKGLSVNYFNGKEKGNHGQTQVTLLHVVLSS